MLGFFPDPKQGLQLMIDPASDTATPAAPKPVLDSRAALTQFAKCLGVPLAIMAVVFLGFTRGEVLGGVFAPIGQAIAATAEFVFSVFALVAAYHPGGLLLLGGALIAGCTCYFIKTDGMTRGLGNKVDTLARIVGWAGGAAVVLAFLGVLTYPGDAIRYFHTNPSSLSPREQDALFAGRGGHMNYMNCRRIAGAYLSASANTQQRMAVEVNGAKVMAGQHPAEHCQMLSFNKVLYGYAHSNIFTDNRSSNSD